jgi:hypothetical protein
MGRGRGNPGRALALGAMSLLTLAACGAEDHENDQRPALPIEVTVSITEESVDVSPSEVGMGGPDQQQLSQNEGIDQPEIEEEDVPQTINFTISNTTDFDTALEIAGGPAKRSSGPIPPNGTGEYKVDLPTGSYEVSAADIPGASASRMTIGTKRFSSSNDLLLP